MRRFALIATLAVGIALVLVSLAVQMESAYVFEALGGTGPGQALVLYHPSRDAHFTDDLSLAFADGLKAAGYTVDRATITKSTPTDVTSDSLVAVVSNTYYWTPDLPTLRYLARAHWSPKTNVVGVMAGAGSTERSERMLKEALESTGARMLKSQSFWLWRPNDEQRIELPNRQMAAEMAMQLGRQVGGAASGGQAIDRSTLLVPR